MKGEGDALVWSEVIVISAHQRAVLDWAPRHGGCKELSQQCPGMVRLCPGGGPNPSQAGAPPLMATGRFSGKKTRGTKAQGEYRVVRRGGKA